MGINDVSDAFDGWLEIVTGSRPTGGAYVAGRWVTGGSPVALSFSGVVQNATPDDMKALPEGNRNDEAIKIHSVFELQVQVGEQPGDVISYKGLSWLAFNTAKRYIGNYSKTILVRL